MAQIDPELLARLQSRLGLSRSRVYALIDAKVRSAHLPRHLAAIAVAGDRGINISRFASLEDLAAIRHSAINAAPAPVVLPGIAAPGKASAKKKKGKSSPQKRRGTTVFVVHGRNDNARNSVFDFLRAVGLRPLEWTQALKLTRKGSPYVGEVLDAAFREAAAIVVLLTPDDEARLKPVFVTARDPAHERKLTGQARPNVLFEAGMAFGRDPNSTVLVQLGETRPFSDVGGRHVLHLSDIAASRLEFTTKLANAGCNVDTSGTDWLSAGNFKLQTSASTKARRRTKQRRSNPRR
jgi:predicted nucleotide-binding protein